MSIYYDNLFLIIIYAIIYNVISKRTKDKKRLIKRFCILISIQLILILGLREITIGTDLVNYIPFYEKCIKFKELVFLSSRFEVGYILLNIVIGGISGNSYVFLFIVAAISLIPIGYIVYKYSKKPFLSFIIYLAFDFYSFLFSGLRQGIAFGITFFSYKYIRERKPIKFIICIVIASLFHKSAIIFLPAYWLAKIKMSKKSIIIFVATFIITFLFRSQIMGIFIKLFSEDYSIVKTNSFTYLFCAIITLVFGIVFYKQMIKNNKYSSQYFIFIMMSVIFLIFTSVGTNMLRISNYYYLFIILFLPEVLDSIEDKKTELLIEYIMFIALIIVFNIYTNQNAFNQSPYICVLDTFK